MTNRWPALLTAMAFAVAGAVCVSLRLAGRSLFVELGSVEFQDTVGLVLLVPVGTLITVFFRNIIGLQTYGAFSPSLLAIGFVHTEIGTGLAVFFLVMTTGLLARVALGRLRILSISRLSLVLVLVALSLAVTVPLLERAGLKPSMHSVLLPMVILTMIIEHFHVTTERDGYPYALQVLTCTFAVAACCVVVFRVGVIERMLIEFPEMLLFAASLLILLGIYSGYRLVELRRFRSIVQEKDAGTDERIR